MTDPETPGLDFAAAGKDMHALMTELFPLCRSITGNGVRQTLEIVRKYIPLVVQEIPSGTPCFDWVIPDEWNPNEAYIRGPDGSTIVDFAENNLHLMGYSEPFSGVLDLNDLAEHIYTDPDVPEAIPYVTSYYSRRWGFAMSQSQFESLEPGAYEVLVDTTLEQGSLTFADLVLPGRQDEEILLSCNTCHPSLANNELSGPVLLTWLTRWLMTQPDRRYTYRILFIPETIGAIAYLSRMAEHLKERTIAGYHLTCVGGPGDFTYIQTRLGGKLVDRISEHVLRRQDIPYEMQGYPERGSDERQFCSPGIDLPIGVLTKSKFESYREYHTSLDNLEFVSPENLAASFEVFVNCISALEANRTYLVNQPCEPNLGKRGLWPTVGGQAYKVQQVHDLLAVLSYSDGAHDLLQISELHDRPIGALRRVADALEEKGLISVIEE